jgi:hypothetical protein
MENDNARKVSEGFVIKVFDKIREVNEQLSIDVKDLRNAVIILGEVFNKRYEGQPRPNELQALLNNWGKTFESRHDNVVDKLNANMTKGEDIHILLKEHCGNSSSKLCSIEEGLKEDEDSLSEIKDGIGKMRSRINFMIGVVAVAFSIFVIAYFFVSATVDKVVETKMEKIEEHYQQDLQERLDDIGKALRQHMEEVEE